MARDSAAVEMWTGRVEEEERVTIGERPNQNVDAFMPCYSESLHYDSAVLSSTTPEPVKVKGVGGIVL